MDVDKHTRTDTHDEESMESTNILLHTKLNTLGITNDSNKVIIIPSDHHV